MTQENTQTVALALSQTDIQSAAAVYATAQKYADKYRVKQLELLTRAAAVGDKLPKDLDDELMNWQVSAKKATAAIANDRKPFTEKAHAFIKAFTAIENEISKDLYQPVQDVRDRSARIHAEEAAAARAKEQAELAAKQKRIDDISELEAQLRNGYAAYLTSVKQTLLEVYSNFKLEQYDEAQEALRSFINSTLSEEAWNAIALVGVEELINEVRTEERFTACAAHFTSEITKYAEYLLEMMPARREELEQGIAESKAAEELRRKQEQEADKAAKEAEARAKAEAEKAKQSAGLKVMVAQANRQEEAPKAIESYAITVDSVDGWRSVVDYYLTNSGAKAEDLGKIRLDQMKAFAEKQAKATGEMITHEGVVYEPKYKAVARATKKKVA